MRARVSPPDSAKAFTIASKAIVSDCSGHVRSQIVSAAVVTGVAVAAGAVGAGVAVGRAGVADYARVQRQCPVQDAGRTLGNAA